MLLAGSGSVRIGKNCDLGLENAALGLRPRATFSRPRSQFFPIRTSQPTNNIYLFSGESILSVLCGRKRLFTGKISSTVQLEHLLDLSIYKVNMKKLLFSLIPKSDPNTQLFFKCATNKNNLSKCEPGTKKTACLLII